MLGRHTPLHVIDASTVNAHRYRNDVLEDNLSFSSLGFIFMDDNAKRSKVHIVDGFLKEQKYSLYELAQVISRAQCY